MTNYYIVADPEAKWVEHARAGAKVPLRLSTNLASRNDWCPRFEVTATGIEYKGNYAAGTLRLEEVTDEDGSVTQTYTDMRVLKVMVRRGVMLLVPNEKDKELVCRLLPLTERSYIEFHEEELSLIGSVSEEPKSDNFVLLQQMAESETFVFEIIVSSSFEYYDENGNLQVGQFGEIDYYPENIKNMVTDMYLTTGEEGYVGKTIFPGTDRLYNSTNGHIMMYVNSDLSPLGKAEALAHELGHGYIFYVTDGNYEAAGHMPMRNREGNLELKRVIKNTINETLKNF